MSFSPERVRVRGRSPAFNALAATFENQDANASDQKPNPRNLSTPPPAARKVYPKSVSPDSAPKSAAIARLSASFESSKESIKATIIPKSLKVSPVANKPKPEANAKGGIVTMSNRIESLTIQKDMKGTDTGDERELSMFPYERLKVNSADPVTEIDATKRETYLSPSEFQEKFGMTKVAFYKLPKWRQNKLKMTLQLF